MDSLYLVALVSFLLIISIFKLAIFHISLKLYQYLNEKYPEKNMSQKIYRPGLLFGSTLILILFSKKLEVDEYSKLQVKKIKLFYLLSVLVGIPFIIYLMTELNQR